MKEFDEMSIEEQDALLGEIFTIKNKKDEKGIQSRNNFLERQTRTIKDTFLSWRNKKQSQKQSAQEISR